MSGKATYRTRVFRFLTATVFILSLLAFRVGIVAADSVIPGAVYTMTNAASGNAIQEYERAADGTLVLGGTFLTGGLGSGSGLGSQGAIVLSPDHQWLFAVNAGSNDISVFSVQPQSLQLVEKMPSHGSRPISLAFLDTYLYVLNAGDGGNIAGFEIAPDGHLAFIVGSVQPLSNDGVGPAASPEEIAFTPDGEHLVVSEKGSNLIDSYNVEKGVAHGPIVNLSAGPAPYGFGFTGSNILVISEAASSSASSYKVTGKGLKGISLSVPDTQAAACWLVVTADGKFAYAANAASGTVSAYQVSDRGILTLRSANGIDGSTGAGSHPIDMSFGSHDQFLYVLASGSNTISAFMVNLDGSLSFITMVASPAGASGLAAW